MRRCSTRSTSTNRRLPTFKWATLPPWLGFSSPSSVWRRFFPSSLPATGSIMATSARDAVMTTASMLTRVMRKPPTRWRSIIIHGFLILGALVMIYPLLWLASSSLKPANLIFSDLSLWPSKVRLQNYVDGWRGAALPFSTFFLNSFIISGLAVVGNVTACSMVAYAFARLNFIFKRTLFALMMLTIMLPLHATLIPQYALFYNLGWVNTFLPLTVPKFLAVDSFFIFLLVQFIRGIPR